MRAMTDIIAAIPSDTITVKMKVSRMEDKFKKLGTVVNVCKINNSDKTRRKKFLSF